MAANLKRSYMYLKLPRQFERRSVRLCLQWTKSFNRSISQPFEIYQPIILQCEFNNSETKMKKCWAKDAFT